MAVLEVIVANITPSDATRLLSSNHQNRVLNKGRVNKYANDMRMGAWRESGQGITIYREPNPPHNEYLQDGQTRLYAIIESGTTQRMILVYVDEPVFDVIDTGQTRSLQQMLGIHFRGSGNSVFMTVTATALSIRDVLIPNGDLAFRSDSKSARIHRLAENLQDYEIAAPIIMSGLKHCGRITGPSGHIAALLSLTKAMDTNVVLPFFERVATGEGLKIGTPEYAMREALLKRLFSRSLARHESVAHHNVHIHWYEAALRAWNAYAKGEEMETVRVSGSIPPILTLSGKKIVTKARVNSMTDRKAAASR